MTTVAKNLQIGMEIEFNDDLHVVTFIEEADATDGNDERLVILYLDGITGGVPVNRHRPFPTFGEEGEGGE